MDNKKSLEAGGEEKFPQKLRDLDKETTEFLWRLSSEQREALDWVAGLETWQRDRLDLFLSLSKENFEAGFTIVEWWSKIRWLGKTGFWIMGGVVALLIFVNQVAAFISTYLKDGTP